MYGWVPSGATGRTHGFRFIAACEGFSLGFPRFVACALRAAVDAANFRVEPGTQTS
jgi:hypothetical protein